MGSINRMRAATTSAQIQRRLRLITTLRPGWANDGVQDSVQSVGKPARGCQSNFCSLRFPRRQPSAFFGAGIQLWLLRTDGRGGRPVGHTDVVLGRPCGYHLLFAEAVFSGIDELSAPNQPDRSADQG